MVLMLEFWKNRIMSSSRDWKSVDSFKYLWGYIDNKTVRAILGNSLVADKKG